MTSPIAKLKRLYPEAGELAVGDAYGDLRFDSPAPERPYAIVNMIATVDGRARIGDDTATLGGETDLRLLVKLREQVDCVLAGTRTIAADRYKGPASRPETRAAREARGLRPRPLLATISRSGDVPWDAPAFQDEDVECVIFSEAELATGRARARLTQVRATRPDAVARALGEDFGVRGLLLEGGPSLNAAFLAAGLVDELFLTIAPLLTGAEPAFPIVAGDLGEGVEMVLRSVMVDAEDHLYLRYRVGRNDD